jgi:hypothetical protein
MSPEKQRIAIAEAHGYEIKKEIHPPESWGWFNPDGKIITSGYITEEYCLSLGFYKLPDYLNDLNAIMKLVRVIMDGPYGALRYNLMQALCDVMPLGSWLPMAKAEQWSEAVLKTLNLWEESE